MTRTNYLINRDEILYSSSLFNNTAGPATVSQASTIGAYRWRELLFFSVRFEKDEVILTFQQKKSTSEGINLQKFENPFRSASDR
jgi:hypothetical protein